jgi:L-cystine transport system permease protein
MLNDIFDIHIFSQGFISILSKLPITLVITLTSAIFGFVIAVLFALTKTYKVKILCPIVNGICSFLRGTPILLQLYLIYFLLPILIDIFAEFTGIPFKGKDFPVFIMVVFALGLNLSSFLSETIRSGLEAVDKGEIEAALSLGMTNGQLFREVIFPESIRIFIPNFAVNLIICLHGSSLAFYVTLVEITAQANIFAQFNWRYLEVFFGAGIIYWALTAVIELLTHLAENYLNRGERDSSQRQLVKK